MIYINETINIFEGKQTLNTIEDCLFTENNSTDENVGGVIYINNFGNNLSFIRSNFTNNYGANGAAINLISSQTKSLMEIIDCIFFENNSTELGGAIYFQTLSGNTSILRSNFINNYASNGAAIYTFSSQSNSLMEIADCTFFENNSTYNGGAIFFDTITGNTSIVRTILQIIMRFLF